MAHYGTSSYRQKDVGVFIDNGILTFLRTKKEMTPLFWNIVEGYFRKAMQVVGEKVRTNITSMNAVGSGYMRKNIVTTVTVKARAAIPIKAEVGTRAWYDILVEKGWGRHSPTGYMPANIKSTGIVPPSAAIRRKYWKRSPKVPRPFIGDAVKSTRTVVTALFKEGFRQASIKYLGANKAKPKHNLNKVLGGIR